jgi:hypothetical protein
MLRCTSYPAAGRQTWHATIFKLLGFPQAPSEWAGGASEQLCHQAIIGVQQAAGGSQK